MIIFSFTNINQPKAYQLLQGQESSLVDLVNPLVGSASSHALSNGNTYPAIAGSSLKPGD